MARAILTEKDFATTPIPQGAVVWWLGTAASIPAGWEIANGSVSVNDSTYTRPDLRSRYLRGMASSIGATGGTDSHGHSIGSHNHGGTSNSASALNQDQENISGNPFIRDHSHTVNAATGGLNSTTNANHPAYMEGIPIVYCLKGGGTRGRLTPREVKASGLPPRKVIVALHSTTIPAGWTKCDGSTGNSVVTPNLVGKYLRGVPNGSTNPGATGGAATHGHSTTHSHTSGSASNQFTGSTFSQEQGPGAVSNHTHTIGGATTATDTPNTEPPYVETNYIMFTGHGANAAATASARFDAADLAAKLQLPRGTVVAWNDTLANIPSTHRNCDGSAWANGAPAGYGANRPNLQGRFMRHNTGGDAGTTGGGDTHTHTGDTHTHSLATANANASGENASGGNSGTHSHSGGSTSWTSIETKSSLPPYYEVAWIARD